MHENRALCSLQVISNVTFLLFFSIGDMGSEVGAGFGEPGFGSLGPILRRGIPEKYCLPYCA